MPINSVYWAPGTSPQEHAAYYANKAATQGPEDRANNPGAYQKVRRAAAGRGTFWEEAERLKGLLASFPGGSTSTSTTLPNEGTPVYGDLEGANTEEFGRAKDRVGKLTRGSLRGLRESLASSGRLGGGTEAVGTAEVLGSGAGQLADTVREQAIQNVGRRQHTMDQNFAAQRDAANRAAAAAQAQSQAQYQAYLSALQALMRSHEGMY